MRESRTIYKSSTLIFDTCLGRFPSLTKRKLRPYFPNYVTGFFFFFSFLLISKSKHKLFSPALIPPPNYRSIKLLIRGDSC